MSELLFQNFYDKNINVDGQNTKVVKIYEHIVNKDKYGSRYKNWNSDYDEFTYPNNLILITKNNEIIILSD